MAVGAIIGDPGITQGIILSMMAILSGADMEPLVNAGDVVLVSDWYQYGLGFDQIENGDIIVVQQKEEGSKYYRHYVSQVVDKIENQPYPIYNETRYRDLLVVQGIQDPDNPLNDYESTDEADWSRDWRIVHPVEFEGVVVDVLPNAAAKYVQQEQQDTKQS